MLLPAFPLPITFPVIFNTHPEFASTPLHLADVLVAVDITFPVMFTIAGADILNARLVLVVVVVKFVTSPIILTIQLEITSIVVLLLPPTFRIIEFILTVIPKAFTTTKEEVTLLDFPVIPLALVQVIFLFDTIVKKLVVVFVGVSVKTVKSTSATTLCAITTSSADVGTTPPTHVAVSLQFPLAALVIFDIL